MFTNLLTGFTVLTYSLVSFIDSCLFTELNSSEFSNSNHMMYFNYFVDPWHEYLRSTWLQCFSYFVDGIDKFVCISVIHFYIFLDIYHRVIWSLLKDLINITNNNICLPLLCLFLVVYGETGWAASFDPFCI